ncbi:MAG: inorganic diphosphatase [Candidatus Spechtbacterales bacterium]
MLLEKLPRGENFPEGFNVVVEIPQGSPVKYEIDKDSGAIFVDRFAYSSMVYPFNYGFIPHTKADDGDPTDVLVLSTYPVHPGTVIPSRAIGMLEMEDESGIDHKILAVPTKKVDPFYAGIEDVEDLDSATRDKIRHFFERYKELEPKKWVKVKNFHGKDKALEEIKKSAE